MAPGRKTLETASRGAGGVGRWVLGQGGIGWGGVGRGCKPSQVRRNGGGGAFPAVFPLWCGGRHLRPSSNDR